MFSKMMSSAFLSWKRVLLATRLKWLSLYVITLYHCDALGGWTLMALDPSKTGSVAFSLKGDVIYVSEPDNAYVSDHGDYWTLTLSNGIIYTLTQDHWDLSLMNYGQPVYHDFYFNGEEIVPSADVSNYVKMKKRIRALEAKEDRTDDEKKELESKRDELKGGIATLENMLDQERETNDRLRCQLEEEAKRNREGREKSKKNAIRKREEENDRKRRDSEYIRQLQEENMKMAKMIEGFKDKEKRGGKERQSHSVGKEQKKLKAKNKIANDQDASFIVNKSVTEKKIKTERKQTTKVTSVDDRVSGDFDLVRTKGIKQTEPTIEPMVLQLRQIPVEMPGVVSAGQGGGGGLEPPDMGAMGGMANPDRTGQ
ncbi:MAG: hypothetical protein ACPG5T_04120, partial [Endozoicomonas sp.]